jgi:hypothetical protein
MSVERRIFQNTCAERVDIARRRLHGTMKSPVMPLTPSLADGQWIQFGVPDESGR